MFVLAAFAQGTRAAAAAPAFPQWIAELAAAVCREGRFDEAGLSALLKAHGRNPFRIRIAGAGGPALRARVRLAEGGMLALSLRLAGSPRQRLRVALSGAQGPARRDHLLQLSPDCAANLARSAVYGPRGHPQRLVHFEADLARVRAVEPLNPPVPPGADPGGVAVALVDSGINYTLPQVAPRLARAAGGAIHGYDFAEDDRRPFDLDPTRPAIQPVRHGTAVASILLREAPRARLVPFRYPGRAMQRFADVVAHAAKGPARIVAMPLGGYRKGEWLAFAAAARRHRELLFVVSAGNDGRDIDAEPVYPAAFEIDNMLVVTSTDAFGRIAPGSNWGGHSVDIGVPAERIEVFDHRGARTRASGSSYAVPRVAALAARLLAAEPGRDAAALKAAILARAAPLLGRGKPTRHGWIPNPALD